MEGFMNWNPRNGLGFCFTMTNRSGSASQSHRLFLIFAYFMMYNQFVAFQPIYSDFLSFYHHVTIIFQSPFPRCSDLCRSCSHHVHPISGPKNGGRTWQNCNDLTQDTCSDPGFVGRCSGHCCETPQRAGRAGATCDRCVELHPELGDLSVTLLIKLY